MIVAFTQWKPNTQTYSICIRDLQYISISQYIDTLVEYHIVIRCSMNIEISDSAEQCMFHAVNITFLCV